MRDGGKERGRIEEREKKWRREGRRVSVRRDSVSVPLQGEIADTIHVVCMGYKTFNTQCFASPCAKLKWRTINLLQLRSAQERKECIHRNLIVVTKHIAH
jgi:hypothetical protein